MGKKVTRPPMVPLALDAQQVGQALGLSVSAVYELWKTGELPVIQIRTEQRTRIWDLENWLKDRPLVAR